MEPEVSLQHSQEPSNCPYSEPDQFIPCPLTTSWRSILILTSHLRLGLPGFLFPSVSSLKANRFSASQEIPCILWKPKDYYRVYKSRHLSLTWARSIQSTPYVPLLSLRLPHQPLNAPPSPHTCYVLCPSHASRFGHPNNVRWGVQVIKLLII